MTHLQKNLLSGVLFSALSLSCLNANATNGYFAHGYGARSKAMAGTGVAFSQDAVAGALNPASLIYVGIRLDVEVELLATNLKRDNERGLTVRPELVEGWTDHAPYTKDNFYRSVSYCAG